MTTPANAAPGWYPDPARPGGQRWWTGVGWSESTQAGSPPTPPWSGVPSGQPPAYYGQPPAYHGQPPVSPGHPAAYTPQPPLYPGQAAGAYPAYSPYATPTAALDPPAAPRSFGGAISSVIRNYARFGGRASRSEFWYWYLFSTLIGGGGYLLALIVLAADSSALTWIGVLLAILLMSFGLAIILPSLAVTVRRLRDAGLAWPLIFLGLIPYVGGIVVLILCAQSPKPWPLPRV